MEPYSRRALSSNGLGSIDLIRSRCAQRRIGLAECMGHFFGDGPNGHTQIDGPPSCQPCRRVCRSVLVGGRLRHISIP